MEKERRTERRPGLSLSTVRQETNAFGRTEVNWSSKDACMQCSGSGGEFAFGRKGRLARLLQLIT